MTIPTNSTVATGRVRSHPRWDAAGGSLTLDELHHDRMLAARVVMLYGAKYKPIFDIFDFAVLEREKEDVVLERIRRLSVA